MNIQNLMAQAKKMQDGMEKTIKEIEEMEFISEKNGIKIVVYGSNVVKQIIINDKNLLKDDELLSDVILLTVNDALSQVKKIKEEKLGKYSAGLGGMF